LVLDEVTNHLDIMTVDSLIKALHPKTGYQGGVVLVSHDTRFIDQVCNELWVCADGNMKKYVPEKVALGGYEEGALEGTSGIREYKEKILQSCE
jgi:ATPase subunit of ABC transporter with duplicated ATPase domains